MKYYREIDGLRALAVISVILYHLDFSIVTGGYIGVDIFFVISGFLITNSIRSDIQASTYTISGFYIRRIRRIIPALLFVVIIIIPFAYYILPTDELEEFLKSVFSVSTFTSNLFFWKNSDYFSTASELKPLLHTWSLGIEEQFYIIFPIFMLLTRKISDKNIILLLLIFALSSFMASVPSIGVSNPVATFYLPVTRFWELLVGSLLAFGTRYIPYKKGVLNNLISLAGLALIISSIVLLDKNSIFSGISVLYAVIGTALIIYSCKQGTFLSVALTNRYIVYLGLISYSLYLWHWPIIALIKNTTVGELGIGTQMFVLGLTFILSSFTYTFVEQPFRKVKKLKSFLQIRTGIISLALLSVASGFILYTVDSYGTRLSATTGAKCFVEEETLKSTQRCSFGTLNTNRIFLLYGDSHSNAMLPVFEKFAVENGYRGIHALSAGCAPVFGVFRLDEGMNASSCTGEFSENVRKFLIKNNERIEMVFLVSRWTLYEKGWIQNGRLQKATHFLSDNETESLLPSESSKVLKRALLKTVDEITGKLGIKTTILAPVPVLPAHVRKLKHEVSRKSYESQRAFVDGIFKTLELNPLVKIIDPIDVLCGADVCMTYADDKTTPLYIDDNHLSFDGALLFYPYLKNIMD